MKRIFVVLFLSSTLFSCKKDTVDNDTVDNDPVGKEDKEIKPSLHFSGSTSDTVYIIDFSTEIHGKFDTGHHDQSGRMVYTISAYQEGLSSYFFAIKLLTDSTGKIPEGEYYLTPDIINDTVFGYTTIKGVGRFEYKGEEPGNFESWNGTEWTDRTDWAKIIITKNQDDYLNGEFSGRFTRNEVIYGDMKMTFSGSFNNIKSEYYQ